MLGFLSQLICLPSSKNHSKYRQPLGGAISRHAGMRQRCILCDSCTRIVGFVTCRPVRHIVALFARSGGKLGFPDFGTGVASHQCTADECSYNANFVC